MADSFRSYESWFNELSAPAGSGNPSVTYDLTGDIARPDPGAPAPQPTQQPAAQTPQAPKPTTQQQPSAGAYSYQPAGGSATPISGAPGTAPQINLSNQGGLNAPVNYANLFAPLQGQIQAARQNLSGAVSAFTGAAGPYRTFESVGGAETLNQALQPGADLAGARNLVGARYTGPMGLDQATMDSLTRELAKLQPAGRSLTSGLGAEDLVRQRSSGLTAGQRRLEAQSLLADQSYRDTANQYQQAIQSLFGDYTRSQEEARGIAQARQAQEADISRLAQEQLAGRGEGLATDLAQRVERARANERPLQEAYNRFTASGSAEDLAALDALTDLDLSGYNTDLRRRATEAAAAKQSVMDDPRFAALKDVPTLALGTTSHGREALFLPKEWVAANKHKYTKRQLKEIQSLARERQYALEAAGFSPGTAKRHAPKLGTAGETMGKYAAFDPLYYREDIREPFTNADPRSFINFNIGTPATAETLASADERNLYNTIANLLGSEQRLATPGIDEVPTGLTSELDRYKSEEQRLYDAVLEQLGRSEAGWEGRVAKQRGRARAASTFGAKMAGRMPGGRNLRSIAQRIGAPGLRIAPGPIATNF